MKAIVCTQIGGEELLELRDDWPSSPCGPNQVRIDVRAASVNFPDILMIRDLYQVKLPRPFVPGNECSGVVIELGADISHVAVGDRVLALTGSGAFAEEVVVSTPPMQVHRIPDEMPWEHAAAFNMIYGTAGHAWDRAQLQAGESVLIHAAAGGAGSAAIQLAVHAGARVFATAGSDDKVKLCQELGADVAINYRDDDFAAVVMAETGQRGVDVVFDNVGEAVLEQSLACTAYNGRYLMMGFASDKTKADEPFIVPRRVAAGNLKLCGVLLAYVEPEIIPLAKQARGLNLLPRSLGEDITKQIIELVRTKAVRPVVGQVRPFEDIPAAIEAMANRETMGRTIITLDG